jgi:D-beta-D-heptose 7-phosphate kinase/D-beta-D-heptose 1-phosphate adenosyltransferase
VARNVREFQADTRLMGVAGNDAGGRHLRELLTGAGIDIAGIEEDASRPTTVKTRVMARNQQVVRVDREQPGALSEAQTARAIARLAGALADVEAVIVADYGKGFVSQSLADAISREARRYGRILAVDPHPHTLLAWHGATIVKPNRAEAFLAVGMPPSEPAVSPLQDAPLLEAGTRLMDRWKPAYLLITLGEQGMLLLGDGEPYHIPAHAKDVFDVSGAGDTAIAVLTLALCAGASAMEAAELANRASGIVVGKVGTATASVSEMISDLSCQ